MVITRTPAEHLASFPAPTPHIFEHSTTSLTLTRLCPTVRASFLASVPHPMANLTDAFNSISDLENIRKPEELKECELWGLAFFSKKKFKI